MNKYEEDVVERKALLMKVYRSLPEHDQKRFRKQYGLPGNVTNYEMSFAIAYCRIRIRGYKRLLNFDFHEAEKSRGRPRRT